MKSVKFIIVISAAGMCAVIGMSAYAHYRRASELEDERAAVEKYRAVHAADLARVEAVSSSAQARAVTLRTQLQEITAKKNAQSPRPAVLALPSEQAAGMAKIAATNWRDLLLETKPALQAMYLDSYRAGLPATYGPLWKKLGLTGDQISKFSDVMAAAEERALDLKAAIRAQSLSPADQAVQELKKQADEQKRAAQVDLLGAKGYEKLQEFEAARPFFGMVNTLAGQLAFTDSPLSQPQAEALTKILVRPDVPRIISGLDQAMFENHPAPQFLDVDHTLTEARKILSPPQYTRFEAEITRQHRVIEVFNEIRQMPDPMIGFTFGRR